MLAALTCPRCARSLGRTTSRHGVFWQCDACHGKALGLDVLRRTFAREQVNAVWRRTLVSKVPSGLACPSCRNEMTEVCATVEPEPRIDVCRLCHFVWFDAEELARFTPLPPKAEAKETKLSLEARQALALVQVEALAREAEGPEFGSQPPDEFWKQIAALFGLPVELNDRADPRPPWLTWTLALVIAAVMAMTFRDLEGAIRAWGLIPAQFDRAGGATFVTSFFLHGGVLHLLGNLYFLLTFGDNVEVHLGRWRYLLLIAVATLAGDAWHVLLAPGSTLPAIGASGGISGIICFYALTFPRERLALGWFQLGWTGWLRCPAWFALLLWFALQALGIIKQIGGFTNVSAAAHLGGSAVGLLAWLLWRNREAG